jgi:hypothetical protein
MKSLFKSILNLNILGQINGPGRKKQKHLRLISQSPSESRIDQTSFDLMDLSDVFEVSRQVRLGCC